MLMISNMAAAQLDGTDGNGLHNKLAIFSVVVVVDVNLKRGTVAYAEENYNHKKWGNPKKYAHKTNLFEGNGHITLIDVSFNKGNHKTGREISGLIYPKES